MNTDKKDIIFQFIMLTVLLSPIYVALFIDSIIVKILGVIWILFFTLALLGFYIKDKMNEEKEKEDNKKILQINVFSDAENLKEGIKEAYERFQRGVE